jgi:2-C-methyl-D-erythritol 4-phosphate cytidylyltransferase
MSVLVIIPAAGSGARFGGDVPKQFLQLAGTPILLRTIERFYDDDRVAHIIVAVAQPLLSNIKQTERVRFVAGGSTRQESVMNALEAAADGDFELVAVHDAVRPFFKTAAFHALLDAAAEHGGAFPGVPVSDTIHATSAGRIVWTPDRATLFAAQTPQCFRIDVLREVLQKAKEERIEGTDEAGLAARYGYDVRVLPGDASNFKITRPEDLAYAEKHFEELNAQ